MGSKVLVIGATGAQGIPVVRALVADRRYEVVIFTRDASSSRAKMLLELDGVSAFEGNATNEKDLRAALAQVDRVYCNLDGFAIGEVSETFWGIRTFELAAELGLAHFVWGSIDYLVKKGGFASKYRCGHYDAKGRVAELVLQQRPASMAVSVLTSGPYMEMLYDGMFAPHTLPDGTLLFAHPIGQGRVPMIYLDDLGRYARWLFDHPEEANGLDLEIATEHVGWLQLVDCVQRVTGRKAVFKNLELADYLARSRIDPTTPAAWAKADGSPLPGGQTFWENFSGWWSAWQDDFVTRDYARLDRILPDRVRTLEEWMHKTGYDGGARSILKDMADMKTALAPKT